ncbi:MAG: hypothetical protein ACI87W_001715 [Halieaceae bacterium]
MILENQRILHREHSVIRGDFLLLAKSVASALQESHNSLLRESYRWSIAQPLAGPDYRHDALKTFLPRSFPLGIFNMCCIFAAGDPGNFVERHERSWGVQPAVQQTNAHFLEPDTRKTGNYIRAFG